MPKQTKSDWKQELDSKLASQRITKKKVDSGGKKIPQMTFRRMFGVANSHYKDWLRTQPAYQTAKQAARGLPPGRKLEPFQELTGVRNPSTGKPFTVLGLLRHQYNGQFPSKHYNSKKSIKKLAEANGIYKVSKGTIALIKLLDGNSASRIIAWHKLNFGQKESIPDAEAMLYLSKEVVPHLQSAIGAQERLMNNVRKAGMGGSGRIVGTEQYPNWSTTNPPHSHPRTPGWTSQPVPRRIGRGKNKGQMQQRHPEQYAPISFTEPDPSSIYNPHFQTKQEQRMQQRQKPQKAVRTYDLPLLESYGQRDTPMVPEGYATATKRPRPDEPFQNLYYQSRDEPMSAPPTRMQRV